MIQTNDLRTHTQISLLLFPNTNPPPTPLMHLPSNWWPRLENMVFFLFLLIKQTVRNSYEQLQTSQKLGRCMIHKEN